METQILTLDEMPDRLCASLDDLIALSFEGLRLGDLPPASKRAVLVQDDQILAHAAVQARSFPIGDRSFQGYILGCVCTHPDARQKGIGTKVTLSLLAALDICSGPFVVLNCGESVTAFYAKIGFMLIAQNAAYIRDGRLEIDPDPVMAIGLSPDFDVWQLKCDPFHLGQDF